MAIENPDLLVSLGRLERFKSKLAPVAISGSYDDLEGAPTNLSAFDNDAGYFTTTDLATDADIDAMFED